MRHSIFIEGENFSQEILRDLQLRTTEPIQLENGWVIQQVPPNEFWSLKSEGTTGIDQKWPIYEQIPQREQYVNYGASTCLIVYIFNAASNEYKSGHFNVVLPPKLSMTIKALDELTSFKMYQFMLLDLKNMPRSTSRKVLLFGQHIHYMKLPVSYKEYNEWKKAQGSVVANLQAAGVSANEIIDLRGGTYGGTSTLFDRLKKKIYFCESVYEAQQQE